MDKQAELKTVTEVVKDILLKHESARESDETLYLFYLNKCNISKNTSIGDIFTKIKNKEISSPESVSRARRKLQENFSELRSREDIESARRALEKDYEEYSRINL